MAAAAPMVLSGASTAVGMAGAISQGNSAQAAANYNANVQQQQATAAVAQAAEDERRLRVQTKKQIGGIRANIGASGITTEGSALDVLESSASNGELDALTVRHQGQMKAWGLQSSANMSLLEGQNAKRESEFASASYLLKGISSAAGSMGGGKGG